MDNSIDLIVQAKQGSPNAFNQLMRQWYQRIYNFSYRQLKQHDLAQEVTQKTFIKAYEKLDTLHDNDRFKPWLYRIANNYCTDEGRRNARMNKLKQVVGLTAEIQQSPELDYQQEETKSVFRTLIDEIPGPQRTVILMKEYEGLKFREIAEILGESENTIKSRMYYGLTALRKIIQEKNIQKEQLL